MEREAVQAMTGCHQRSVLLVGAGGVGRKRAAAIAAHKGTHLVAVCDVDEMSASELASQYGASVYTDWSAAIRDAAADLVVVSTTHGALSRISVAALTTIDDRSSAGVSRHEGNAPAALATDCPTASSESFARTRGKSADRTARQNRSR